jgi:hypothetical protein
MNSRRKEELEGEQRREEQRPPFCTRCFEARNEVSRVAKTLNAAK